MENPPIRMPLGQAQEGRIPAYIRISYMIRLVGTGTTALLSRWPLRSIQARKRGERGFTMHYNIIPEKKTQKNEKYHRWKAYHQPPRFLNRQHFRFTKQVYIQRQDALKWGDMELFWAYFLWAQGILYLVQYIVVLFCSILIADNRASAACWCRVWCGGAAWILSAVASCALWFVLASGYNGRQAVLRVF